MQMHRHWQAIEARSFDGTGGVHVVAAERGTDSGGGQNIVPGRMGWDALALLTNKDHRSFYYRRAVQYPAGGIYPFTPQHLQQLGFQHTWLDVAWPGTEIIAMFAGQGCLPGGDEMDLRSRAGLWTAALRALRVECEEWLLVV